MTWSNILYSPCICERYLRLFFTVLEKSDVECVRANGVILASDLACRFPNLIEPWTPRLYARCAHPSPTQPHTSHTLTG